MMNGSVNIPDRGHKHGNTQGLPHGGEPGAGAVQGVDV